MILSLRNRLKILVYLGAGILFVVAIFDGGPMVGGVTLGRLAIVEAGLIALLTIFDRWLWRQRMAVTVVRSGPVLRGTWKGTVTSADDGTSYEAYLLVRQTFTEVEMRLMTDESTSESSSCQLMKRPEGLSVIEYAYENVPRPAVRQRSEIHFGGARMEAVGAWPDGLAGEYWTSRQSKGELKFDQRSPTLAQSFDDARRLFEA